MLEDQHYKYYIQMIAISILLVHCYETTYHILLIDHEKNVRELCESGIFANVFLSFLSHTEFLCI